MQVVSGSTLHRDVILVRKRVSNDSAVRWGRWGAAGYSYNYNNGLVCTIKNHPRVWDTLNLE